MCSFVQRDSTVAFHPLLLPYKFSPSYLEEDIEEAKRTGFQKSPVSEG
jgi:hypothetical protein